MSEPKADYITENRKMIGWNRQIEIQDDSDLRKYRIELPNLYDDSDLDPYEFRLLAHYKRVGICTEGTTTTAAICRMSTGQVSQKRQSIRKKGFIRMEKVKISSLEYSYRITVVDRWIENFNRYAKPITPSPHEYPPSPHEGKKVVVVVDSENLYTTYSSEIGVITPMIADSIDDWSNLVSSEWILKAIHEAATQNKRNWKYCEAILKRWKAQGFMDDGKKLKESSKPEFIPPIIRTGVPRPSNVPAPKIPGVSK